MLVSARAAGAFKVGTALQRRRNVSWEPVVDLDPRTRGVHVTRARFRPYMEGMAVLVAAALLAGGIVAGAAHASEGAPVGRAGESVGEDPDLRQKKPVSK